MDADTKIRPSSQRQNITAIIYDRRGRVLSIGKNSYVKTHPYQALLARKCNHKEKIFLHAEIHAITKCANLDRAHRMVITRFDRSGQPVNAQPCEICATAIKATKIKIVDHT